MRWAQSWLIGGAALGWLLALSGCWPQSARGDELADIRATAAYTESAATFNSLSDADAFTYINLLTVDSYWSMDALGSNTPSIDLITRRNKRRKGRFYADALLTTTSELRLESTGANITDWAAQFQPYSFDAENGYVASAFRGLVRYTNAEQTLTAAGTTYRINYERLMLGVALVTDMWGFKFSFGPKASIRRDSFTPQGSHDRVLSESITPGFHFQIASPRGDNPPEFEWTFSRLDISFSKKFFQDVSVDLRWVDVPDPRDDGKRSPRLWELEAQIRWGAISNRRLLGGKGRIWALTGAFYYNYYDGRVAWANGGLEFRVEFLTLAGFAGVVLPDFIGAKPKGNFGASLALTTARAFTAFKSVIFVRYESAPYSYDAAIRGVTEPSPEKLEVGLALTW